MSIFLSPLKLARLERGLTQLDVYLLTGISSPRISLAERGLIKLRPKETDALAKELRVSRAKIAR